MRNEYESHADDAGNKQTEKSDQRSESDDTTDDEFGQNLTGTVRCCCQTGAADDEDVHTKWP